MNKQLAVKIEGQLEAEALRILRETPGLEVVLEHRKEPHEERHEIDAVARFAGAQVRMMVEFKRHVNAATAWTLVHINRGRPDAPLLVIAGVTTTEARKILSDHGVSLIDGVGNARVEIPGLLIHRDAPDREGRRVRIQYKTRLRGKAGVAAQALLLAPQRAWKVHDLARTAGISPGFAHRLLVRLEHEKVVDADGQGPSRVRRVANPTALLDLWAEENLDHPRRLNAYLLAQTPRKLIELLAGRLESAGIGYAMTGAAAANLLAPFVTAIPVVDVWVTDLAAPEDLLKATGAESVPNGHNVSFLQVKADTALAFKEKTGGVWIANRIRLYADLRRDPRRGRDQADHFRRGIIGL